MTYRFKRVLEEIMQEKVPGPSPYFSVFHLLRALEFIEVAPVGRSKLAKSLNVGEGTIRTIIDRLKDVGLIEISKAGCDLTNEGSKFMEEYRSVFAKKAKIGKNELTFTSYNVAILVKNLAHKIKAGIEQRDAAIMVGAKSATTIVLQKGCLIIPSISKNVAEDFPEATSQINDNFKLQENDVVVIVSAETMEKAEHGILAAAWTLLN